MLGSINATPCSIITIHIMITTILMIIVIVMN